VLLGLSASGKAEEPIIVAIGIEDLDADTTVGRGGPPMTQRNDSSFLAWGGFDLGVSPQVVARPP